MCVSNHVVVIELCTTQTAQGFTYELKSMLKGEVSLIQVNPHQASYLLTNDQQIIIMHTPPLYV